MTTVTTPSTEAMSTTATRVPRAKRPHTDIKQWRQQWYKELASSTIYIDGFDHQFKQLIKQVFWVRFRTKTLEFFDSQVVTHVITRRRQSEIDRLQPSLGGSDILAKARHQGIHVWSSDKVCRFVTNLTGLPIRTLSDLTILLEVASVTKNASVISPTVPAISRNHPSVIGGVITEFANGSHLANLLMEEKQRSPLECDRELRRNDHVLYKGPYILIWDPSHNYRPVVTKEYKPVVQSGNVNPQAGLANSGDWPQFRITAAGRCPFVYDATIFNRAKRVVAQVPENRPQKQYSQTPVKSNTRDIIESGLNSPVSSASRSLSPSPSPSPSAKSFTQLIPGNSTPTPIQTPEVSRRAINEFKRKLQQMEANDGDLSVLGPARRRLQSIESFSTTDPTKRPSPQTQLSQLQIEAQPPQYTAKQYRRSTITAGYCENCYERYEDFDTHITSRRHRKFATNGKYFVQLDQMLRRIARPLRPASAY
ncbi:hypothetical protein NADFUDRAFT_40090 [Nadsonia fulvescens var. elongata DSM 6958]|uniref:DBF4-type domain-containing protein n=1 Tax=Nadsonia fulvescens var. elongata DSM 6958 TaxID=857566 RepID=A0A1E3PNA8_9ASCO|nr:hypothetical protein NADFUDRAFT_40090 [Nadsonia fulvescens var. elongata DSM 6958]